jgi:hypothetical protein
MRILLLILALALCLAVAPAATAAPFKATLTAGTHTPKANAKWYYTVRAVDLSGKPVRATITTQIVDPFGGVHTVEFGDTHKLVAAFPFTGVFRDFIRFPSDSRGFQLTVRFTVRAKGAKVVRSYWIKAQ